MTANGVRTLAFASGVVAGVLLCATGYLQFAGHDWCATATALVGGAVTIVPLSIDPAPEEAQEHRRTP